MIWNRFFPFYSGKEVSVRKQTGMDSNGLWENEKSIEYQEWNIDNETTVIKLSTVAIAIICFVATKTIIQEIVNIARIIVDDYKNGKLMEIK